ncbi:MAG: ABC transporter substrate-binding protein [Desulforhopalus sp.]|nr:ABC transporter substrate-binding protein [Desulforhopalus sp.]
MKKKLAMCLCGFAAVCLLAVPSAWAENIKLGALLAVTGPASFLGGPEARTLEMLVEQTNAKGGIGGKKVELLLKDTAGNPEKAISLAKQLLEEEKVLAVIGPSSSGETMSIKKIFEDAKTPLLSCAAAEVIVNPLASWVFKTPQNDSSAAIKIFMEMNKLGINKIAVLVDNSGFGKAGKEQLQKIAPDYKIEVVEAEVYDAKATDLSAVVAKIKANPAVQGIINWSVVPAQAIVVKNIRQAGWQVPIFQSHGFGNIKYVEAAGAAAEGVIFPVGRLLMADLLPEGHPQKALLVKYIKDYEGKFQETASAFGGYAYDAFMILEKAILAGGTDKAKVREAIEGLKNLPGTSGIYNFSATDHNGLDLDAFEMMTVKNGKFVPYSSK